MLLAVAPHTALFFRIVLGVLNKLDMLGKPSARR